MWLLALGPLRVLDGDEPRELPGRVPRTILALLLVRRGHAVSVDELLDAVWGDRQPASGAKTLRAHMSRLRDALTPHRDGRTDAVVATVAGGYRLGLARDDIDVDRFEDLAAGGAAALAIGDHAEACERLGAALSLWRGSAFEDVRYEEFAQGEIARLEELRLATLEHRIAADLELGHHHGVVGELRQLTIDYPLRETFWEHLMVALDRADRHADALVAFRDARTVLAEQAGVEPGPVLSRLERRIAARDLSLAVAETVDDRATTESLPCRLASFVGREPEVDELERVLGEQRLVTLTGTGGIGKTTLAVEVARRCQARFSDGARMVELVRVSEASRVADEFAAALDVAIDPSESSLAAITARLRSRSMLLVIDNCEHVLHESAAVVEELVTTCPGVTVLATSRHPLGVVGEQTWSVPSLALPVELDAAWEAPAVRLFRERAEAASSRFCADDEVVGDVVELCRRLDGIPLAIELAAARVRMMSPRDLADRMGDQIDLVSDSGSHRPERHRTLATTLAWSYSLLAEHERIALQRLSVFEGGFGLDAAQAVVAGNPIASDDVIDLVARLIDWSLVRIERADESRYSLLETVRAFATDRLAESGDEATSRRHLAHFADMAAELDDYGVRADAATMRSVELDSANHRRAMANAVDVGDGRAAARIASLLWVHWFFVGRFGPEYRIPAPRILDLLGPEPSVERASMLDSQLAQWVADFRDPSAGSVATTHPGAGFLLVELAYYATRVGEFAVADEAFAAIERWRRHVGQGTVLVHAAEDRAVHAWYRGDLSSADHQLQAALGAVRHDGLHGVEADVLCHLACVALARGDLDAASSWAAQLRALRRTAFDLNELTIQADIVDAHCARRRGDLDEAIRTASNAVKDAVDVDRPMVWVDVTILLAQLAAALGASDLAVSLHRAAESARVRIGVVHPAPLERELTAERSRLPGTFRSPDRTSAALLAPEQVTGFLADVLAAA